MHSPVHYGTETVKEPSPLHAIVRLSAVEHEQQPRLFLARAELSKQLDKGGGFAYVLPPLEAYLGRANDVLEYIVKAQLHRLRQDLILDAGHGDGSVVLP